MDGVDNLRPEFELLGQYFKRLYSNHDLTPELMETIHKHIVFCIKIAVTDKEKAIIGRAKHWFLERSGMKEDEAFPEKSHTQEYQEGFTELDLEILKSWEKRHGT